MANDDLDRIKNGVLGDINPTPTTEDEDIEGMEGGSKHDRTHHPGSRDVTEGTTGGVGTEVGGTRNYRQGTGATGGDIGNRPE
jgi:hypothetical protein